MIEDIVWEQTVDAGAFRCKVVGTDDYRGQLTVEVATSGEILLDIPVGLSYGALFGPDIDDVSDWQIQSIKVIDNWLDKNK